MYPKTAHPEDGNTHALNLHLQAEDARVMAVNTRLERLLGNDLDDLAADVAAKYSGDIAEIISLMYSGQYKPTDVAARLENLLVDEATARAEAAQNDLEAGEALDAAYAAERRHLAA